MLKWLWLLLLISCDLPDPYLRQWELTANSATINCVGDGLVIKHRDGSYGGYFVSNCVDSLQHINFTDGVHLIFKGSHAEMYIEYVDVVIFEDFTLSQQQNIITATGTGQYEPNWTIKLVATGGGGGRPSTSPN